MMGGRPFLPERLETGAGHGAGARTSFWVQGGSRASNGEGGHP